MEDIDIAIPAYNCAAWLDNLMESILQQNVDQWRIVARDDASTDGTATRLAAWKQRLGERMTMVGGSDRRNLGPVGNYDAILSATTSPWVMLADSDDVWRPGKLAALTVQAMRAAEATQGTGTPVLVFTDAQVVDEQLQPVAEVSLALVASQSGGGQCVPPVDSRLPSHQFDNDGEPCLDRFSIADAGRGLESRLVGDDGGGGVRTNRGARRADDPRSLTFYQ